MRAILFERFGGPLRLENVDDPQPTPDGAVIQLSATGLCRSDWHGWQGHDPDIKRLPHVLGHELAGVLVETGANVNKWRPGDRVTMPFVAGCGACPRCRDGQAQVCDRQFQPGFTAWGAFAEYVAVEYADFNLVRIPEELSEVTAASLGCRLSTAYRAVVLQGKVGAGDSVAIFGAGGLGLAAVMIAASLGAEVIAIDVNPLALELANQFGAAHVLRATADDDVVSKVLDLSGGGVEASLDTLGSRETCANSVRSLKKQGRHVQVGLLAGDEACPPIPMELVVARELQLVGSHGLAAADFPGLLELVTSGTLRPERLVREKIALSQVPEKLEVMGNFQHHGISVIDRFQS